MSTLSITKGDGITAYSFTRPIDELKKYAYNGQAFFDAVDLSQATEFWDRRQTIEIYNDGHCLYSLSMSEVKYKGRWRKIITDAWDKGGKVFDFSEGYNELLRQSTK